MSAEVQRCGLKDTHMRLWNIRSVALVRLSNPAICCIGPGPICVYYELSPASLVFILYAIKPPSLVCSTVRGLIIACGSLSLVTWVLHVPFVSPYILRDLTAWALYLAVTIIFLLCLCTVDWEVFWHVITSLKCVLTQEHLDAICAKYFVPEEVHPQLPSPDATMHERPAGKVGMYTRFFDYANYRILFSTFFVSVLTHFRIPFSQFSVFGSAKVSHFEILCRVCNIEPDVSLFRYFYTHNYKNGWFGFTKRPHVRACYFKNLDYVKNWNDHFFWVDEFVVPANARFS
ncbi:hypothetical protein Tco_0576157 [Tanacetum coccineum]